MQSCTNVCSAQVRDKGNNEGNILAALNAEGASMKITTEELVSGLSLNVTNSAEDAFDFICSVLIQSQLLGKSEQESEGPPSIELGQLEKARICLDEWKHPPSSKRHLDLEVRLPRSV